MNLLGTHKNYRYYKKGILAALLLMIVCMLSCTQQSVNIERKQLFDSNWKFFLGDTGAASAPDFNDGSWRTLDLPHDWSIEGK